MTVFLVLPGFYSSCERSNIRGELNYSANTIDVELNSSITEYVSFVEVNPESGDDEDDYAFYAQFTKLD